MTDLFSMEPEKYFAPPGTWTKERFREAVLLRIESGEYLASEKIDGNWSRFVRQGDECKQQTRSVSVVTGTYGESQEKIPFIFNFLQKVTTGDTILIGELFTLSRNVNDVKSILGAGVHKALARQNKDENKLRFYVFDVWMYNGQSFMNTPFEERVKFLKTLKPMLEQNKYIYVAEYVEGEEVFTILEEIFTRGGEGAVLQKKSGVPEPGKRPSWKSIKVKKEVERDVDVFLLKMLPPTREYNGIYIDTWPYWEDLRTGEKIYEENGMMAKRYTNGAPVEPVSKNYYYGWPSAVECGVYDKTGKVWTVCAVSGLTDVMKQDMIKNPEKYNRRAMSVTGMEFTADYSIRHPRLLGFRDDITDKDCTWEKIFDQDF